MSSIVSERTPWYPAVMTFTGSSFGNDNYDNRYYHVHHQDDEHGDFTVEGDAFIHQPYRVISKIDKVDEFVDEDIDLLLEEMMQDPLFDEAFTFNLDRSVSIREEDYSPGYAAGLFIASLLFVVCFILFLSGVGLVGYYLLKLF